MDPRYKTPDANVDRDEDSEFRDLEKFSTTLQWMLRVGAVLALFVLVSSFMQLELLSREFTQAEGEANDMREGAVSGASALLTIATFFVFGRWIVLAHRNLSALGARYIEFTPGWAVGWFFIPIANLWKPYQAMRSLWQGSHSVEKPDIQDTTWVLPVWWTFWLASSVLGNIAMRLALRSNTIESLTYSTKVAIVNGVVDVVLYLVAAILVGRIWRGQAMQHAHPGKFDPAPGFADSPRQAG